MALGEHFWRPTFRRSSSTSRCPTSSYPHLEGAESHADLIIELAQRESLTVREIPSPLGGGRGHFTFIGTPDQVVDTIVARFEGGAVPTGSTS